MPETGATEVFSTPLTIGVVSDTHLTARATTLPEPLVSGLRGVDLILHAGDVTAAPVLRLFEAIAPVLAVYGNNDEPALLRVLPRERRLHVGRFTLGMIHGHDVDRLTARQAVERTLLGQVDVAVYGHSHRPVCEWIDGHLLFNPGSPTQKRWERRFSYGIIRVADVIEPELRFFDR